MCIFFNVEHPKYCHFSMFLIQQHLEVVHITLLYESLKVQCVFCPHTFHVTSGHMELAATGLGGLATAQGPNQAVCRLVHGLSSKGHFSVLQKGTTEDATGTQVTMCRFITVTF